MVGISALLVVLYLAVELIRGPVEADPRRAAFDVPLADDGGAADAAASETTRTHPLHVLLEMADGQFDVLPGEPGQPIRVEADYDAGSFHLGHDLSLDEQGRPHFTLYFGRTASLVRGLLSARTYKLENRVKVYLPPEVPLVLSIRVSRGQHDVDLSGLAVTQLEFDAAMGQTNLVFREPNPVELELMSLESGQGQLRVRGLGHANPRVLRFRGSMGDSRLDFGGQSRGTTRATIQVSMGSVRIRLPSDRSVRYETSRAFLGTVKIPEASGLQVSQQELEPVDTLHLDLSARFGEIDARRVPARPPTAGTGRRP